MTRWRQGMLSRLVCNCSFIISIFNGWYICCRCNKIRPVSLWRFLEGKWSEALFYHDEVTTMGNLERSCPWCAVKARSVHGDTYNPYTDPNLGQEIEEVVESHRKRMVSQKE